MQPVQLREAWRKRPFQPFRIVLSNGTSYAITSSECMIVMVATTAIAMPCESIGDQIRTFNNDQINELVPLQDPTTLC